MSDLLARPYAWRLVYWDYREQPNWRDVQDALDSVYDSTDYPTIINIPRTGSDSYVLFVSGNRIAVATAQAIFDGTCNACRFNEHGECGSGCACWCKDAEQ